jgi:hypothetical protein
MIMSISILEGTSYFILAYTVIKTGLDWVGPEKKLEPNIFMVWISEMIVLLLGL